jgi:ABC-2 type transport system permease protein
MAANAELIPVHETGWRMGFANLLAKETGAWWRTRTWWVQALIWLLVLNGMLAVMLWGVPEEAGQEEDAGSPTLNALMAEAPGRGLSIFIIMSGIALPIAALIVGQDALIDEKQTGTAAWVLSKPVSRPAFVLTKLLAHGLGFLVVGVALQGLIAYAQISAAAGRPWPLPGFVAALGLIFLNMLWYLTLTVMLGAFFSGRGPVLGIAFGLLFGYQLFVGLANGLLANFGPWAIAVNTPLNAEPLALLAASGAPLPTVVPILFTALGCVVFSALAVWRFGKDEF